MSVCMFVCMQRCLVAPNPIQLCSVRFSLPLSSPPFSLPSLFFRLFPHHLSFFPSTHHLPLLSLLIFKTTSGQALLLVFVQSSQVFPNGLSSPSSSAVEQRVCLQLIRSSFPTPVIKDTFLLRTRKTSVLYTLYQGQQQHTTHTCHSHELRKTYGIPPNDTPPERPWSP